MTLFGIRVFSDVIKVKVEMRSYWIKVSPKSNESFPKRDRKETQRRKWCENGGRAWSVASVNHGTPKIADNHQKLGKRHGTLPLDPRRSQPCQHLDILDFCPLEL